MSAAAAVTGVPIAPPRRPAEEKLQLTLAAPHPDFSLNPLQMGVNLGKSCEREVRPNPCNWEATSRAREGADSIGKCVFPGHCRLTLLRTGLCWEVPWTGSSRGLTDTGMQSGSHAYGIVMSTSTSIAALSPGFELA